ncbi:YigZ family protein [Vibrio rumoiensis]|uniref:YigZ family protein n=1 Tax=Vibrio rumoiensis TaxID=76258 RepID=A0ABW7IQV5_9VIBR
MNEQPYLIPADRVIFEEEIKKSLFITQLAHTPRIESAKAFIEQVKLQHAAARHNCWGFVAGRPDDSLLWGFSDDGEPSGTAGKPILAQLSGSGIGEMTAVVTRYSGGIKLGTGGLVKAYGGGVQQALKQVQTIEKKITTQLQLRLDYSLMPLVQSLMVQYQVTQLDAKFEHRIDLLVEIDIREADVFKQTLVNKTGAKVEIKPKHI